MSCAKPGTTSAAIDGNAPGVAPVPPTIRGRGAAAAASDAGDEHQRERKQDERGQQSSTHENARQVTTGNAQIDSPVFRAAVRFG